MHLMKRAALAAAGIAATTGLVLIAPAGGQTGAQTIQASMRTGDGTVVGKVTFSQSSRDGTVTVGYRLKGLPPGFHGFHVHAVGVCEGPSFTSAGGHIGSGESPHGEHIGDMPVVLVNSDGTARGTIQTDRFTLRELKDADGSAAMVHARPDNYANIPTDRYDPDPDAITLATGDAGARQACGVVR